MGGIFETISDYFFAKPHIEFRLSIIGFPNAGKTTILHNLKFGVYQPNTTSTIGMNMEEISIKNVNLKVWDLSGQAKMRTTWKYYYEQVNGLVFVVDSLMDKSELLEVRDTIH